MFCSSAVRISLSGGYDIPKGICVLVFAFGLHRDPRYFRDPEKFNPDRWITDDLGARHPYTYIPFSAGLRNCIGQYNQFCVVGYSRRNELVNSNSYRKRKLNSAIQAIPVQPCLPALYDAENHATMNGAGGRLRESFIENQ